jgi:hypothetical protein
MTMKIAIMGGLILSAVTAPVFADPAHADVVGGALTAGKVAVPWSVYRAKKSKQGAGPQTGPSSTQGTNASGSGHHHK